MSKTHAKPKNRTVLDRRRFLTAAGLAPVAGAVGAATAATDDARTETETPKSGRYRETEHVREAYRLARF